MKSIRIFALFFLVSFSSSIFPCTGFFVEGSPHPIVAKNLDWYFDQGLIFINKRNMEKKSDLIFNQKNLTWISKYMNLTITQDGRDFPWEGINEKGLTVNVFQLVNSIVPPSSDPRPAIELTQWIQYMLDTSATVNEVIQNAKKIRVAQTPRATPGPLPTTTAHYFVCDVTSKCAVLEYISGELIIHETGKDLSYPALANDEYNKSLSYFEHLTSVKNEETILNSSSNQSLNRFSRGAIWSKNYLKSDKNEVEYAFLGLENAAQDITHWRMVFNLESQILSLKTTKAPLIKSFDLNKFDPSCRSSVKMYDINQMTSGEILPKDFDDYNFENNLKLLSENELLSDKIRGVMAHYPETMTRCLE